MNILKHALEIHKKSYNYFTKQIYAHVGICMYNKVFRSLATLYNYYG